MQLKNCNYKTWCKNHELNHKDKLYRALYPYTVVQQINFDEKNIDKVQEIHTSMGVTKVVIQKIELQENGKYRTLFLLESNLDEFALDWNNRKWKEKFQIVYSQEYEFVTIFTKKEDSSKKCLKAFYKGNFQKVSEYKSLQILELLMKNLILDICEEYPLNGEIEKKIKNLKSGLNNYKLPKSFKKGAKNVHLIFPLFSFHRDLWIFFAYDEEKAHRLAYFNCNQCKKLIVVYCVPTLSLHFRCKSPNVKVYSLFEFAGKRRKSIVNYYPRQIWFLMNKMNIEKEYDDNELIEIISSTEVQEIKPQELKEAYSVIKYKPKTDEELFLYLSSMNLLNAWSAKLRTMKPKEKKKLRKINHFKQYLSLVINEVVEHYDEFNCELSINSNMTLIEINGFQFSFQGIKLSKSIKEFIESEKHTEITWKGKRLQPISPSVYKYAKGKIKNNSTD